jgi:release factor glutamine methyltransferase
MEDIDCNLNHCKFVPVTIEEANRLLIASLAGLYEDREAGSICSLVMERITEMQKGQRLLHKTEKLTDTQAAKFRLFLDELLTNRPVQYVLGEAWFGALPFYVDERVLIPRPETEELAEWLLNDVSPTVLGLTVLDIGTGSGCIPVYLSAKRKDFKMIALDNSQAALEVAKKNARIHLANIEFFQIDILNPAQWSSIPPASLIISNPPYIPEKQRKILERHVRDFEPANALFVPDEDPILFYKVIGEFAIEHLKPEGALFLELHHDYAPEIAEWYTKRGFELELRKDFSGNNRMIKAWRY